MIDLDTIDLAVRALLDDDEVPMSTVFATSVRRRTLGSEPRQWSTTTADGRSTSP